MGFKIYKTCSKQNKYLNYSFKWISFIHDSFIESHRINISFLKIPIIVLILSLSPLKLPPPAITTLVHVMSPFPFLLHPSTPSPSPRPLAVILLSIYESVPISLVSSVCSLDSTYEWNHMVFSSLCLISLSIMFTTFIHAVTKGKIFFFFMAK